MSKYYYFKNEEGALFRFRIEQDTEPWNPRFDMDGNIGTMNLYWSRYSLGDNQGKDDADETLNDIIRENVPEDKYTDDNLDYDWSRSKKMKLLMSYVVLLPCYIYEHSGLAISCSNVNYPFNDRWDSGMAGYIYTTKERCSHEWGMEITDDSWRERAIKELEAEVENYDMYLKDECYGYISEQYKDGEWIDGDSCWGYYSSKWGEDLAREIADDGITGEPFISEEEAEEYMKELDVMAQAETIVAI